MTMASSRTWVLQAMQSVVSDIDDITTESAPYLDQAQSLEWRVELVYWDLTAREISGELEIAERQALPFITRCFTISENLFKTWICFHLQQLNLYK